MVKARPNYTLTVALCASITVHVAALYLLAWFYMRYPSSLRFSALSAPQDLAPIFIEAPPPKPPPPPPKDFSDATRQPLRDDSGEADGKGTANRSTPGEHPMEARQGLEQANLTRSAKTDPTDSKLDDAAVPLETGGLTSDDAQPPQPDVAEFGVGPAEPVTLRPATPPHPQPTGAAIEIKGHSARASDTDSFAMVAQSNKVHFRDGEMEARQGRRVTTVRPNYGLAAINDARALLDTTLVLGVTVKGDGHVGDIEILHSSGSQNIDYDTKQAVWKWTFEPKKDKNGQGLPDLWVVTID